MNYTKEFFVKKGKKSVEVRMKKYTHEQRSEFQKKAWKTRRANLKKN